MIWWSLFLSAKNVCRTHHRFQNSSCNTVVIEYDYCCMNYIRDGGNRENNILSCWYGTSKARVLSLSCLTVPLNLGLGLVARCYVRLYPIIHIPRRWRPAHAGDLAVIGRCASAVFSAMQVVKSIFLRYTP